MVATGNSYTEACRSFSVSIKELSSHFQDSEVVTVSLKKFYEALSELQSYYSILFDQAQRSVQSSLRAYLSGELRKAKETKKTFHKFTEELSVAINRNGHAPKSKPLEAGEASAQLSSIQNQFSHHAIDYGYQLNTISSNKGYEILHNLLAFMHAQFTFFHQGYDLLREFDPFMKKVAGQVDIMRKDGAAISKHMENRHSLVAPNRLQDGSSDELVSPMEDPSGSIEMSGYLFKRPRGSRGSSLFKSWSRRWFILNSNKLVYQSESKDVHVVVAEDLRICTVKMADDLERRFCFEIVTPTRSCMLQADSEILRRKWQMFMDAGIERALRISASNKKKEDMAEFTRRSVAVSKGPPIHLLSHSPTPGGHRSETTQSNYSLGLDFLEVAGNTQCADCSGSNPTWASINLGIMLCIECSGIHRSLGVHISKVRSVQLDDWEPELQKIMCGLGNCRVNHIYEFDIPPHIKKPSSDAARSVRETYIKLKYIQHAFIHPHPDFSRPNIPVPPLSINDLLAPSKTPLSLLSGSPKSPHKRSFSPALKIRSPKAAIGRFSRPSSAASSVTDPASLTGSEEDLRKAEARQELSRSCEPNSALHLMAENLLKKQERDKERKTSRIGSWNLGDKLKSARRSSKKISNYAFSKLGEGQEVLKRRLKKGSKDTGEVLREAHSDTEEDSLSTQSTPLLFSMSASTQNLSSLSKDTPSPRPPPKPPRTFKTKDLQDMVADFPDSDGEELGGNFELDGEDVLCAIKEVGIVCSDEGGATQSLANGCIPSTSTGPSAKIMRSESSPQLVHVSSFSGGLGKDEGGQSASGGSNSSESSLRLQTISEDNATTDSARKSDDPPTHKNDDHANDAAHLSDGPSHKNDDDAHGSDDPAHKSDDAHTNDDPAHKSDDAHTNDDPAHKSDESVPISINEVDSVLTVEVDNRIHTVALRSKSLSHAPLETTPPAQQDSAPSISLEAASPAQQGHVPPTPVDYRFSMMSTTSADFYSAESSDGSSLSPSPDLLSKHSLSAGLPQEMRALSSQSAEEEDFDTPPSSPYNSTTPSPNKLSSSDILPSPKHDGTSVPRIHDGSVSPTPTPSGSVLATPTHSGGVATPPTISQKLSSTTSSPGHSIDSSTPKVSCVTSSDDALKSDDTGILKGDHMTNAGHMTSTSTLKADHMTSTGSFEGDHMTSTSTLKATSTGSFEGDHMTSTSTLKATSTGSFEEDHMTSTSTLKAYHVTDTGTLKPGHKLSNEKEGEEEVDGEVFISVQECEVEDQQSNTASGRKDNEKVLTSASKDKWLEHTTSSPQTMERVRSLTYESGTLPARGRSLKRGQMAEMTSLDDNYRTEFGVEGSHLSSSDGLMSYFSQKDLDDILKVVKHQPDAKIETVKEGEEEGEEDVVKDPKSEGDKSEGGRSEEAIVKEEKEEEEEEVENDEKQRNESLEEMVATNCSLIEPTIIPDDVPPNTFLFSSVLGADLPGILCALAHGGSVNHPHEDMEAKTPVLQAVEMGNRVLLEYLYQNGGKLLVTDGKGRGCLHLAAMGDDPNLVMMLLKRGARPRLKDCEGKDPLDYALERENGDIVTMLRMAKFRSEAQNSSDNRQSQCLEELESEFFRDIEVASVSDSERLSGGRLSKPDSTPSLEGSISTASRDSKEPPV